MRTVEHILINLILAKQRCKLQPNPEPGFPDTNTRYGFGYRFGLGSCWVLWHERHKRCADNPLKPRCRKACSGAIMTVGGLADRKQRLAHIIAIDLLTTPISERRAHWEIIAIEQFARKR